jgi:hypothetical protein
VIGDLTWEEKLKYEGLVIPEAMVPENLSLFSDWSVSNHPWEYFDNRMHGWIKPEYLVLELCAGEAPVAHRLTERWGMPADNITCLDNKKPVDPMVEGVNWVFMDLSRLIEALRVDEKTLLQEVRWMWQRYNLVTLMYPAGLDLGGGEEELLRDFFLAEGGVWYYV